MVEEKIIEYVKNNDKESLYIILSDYLLDSFQKFDENIRYVEEKLGIFQLYDNTKFEQDKEKWNEEYLFKEKGRLITNFSKERVEHIKKIIRKLYPEKNKETSRVITCSLGTSNRKTTSRKSSGDDVVPKIAIGAGVVLTGTGLLASKVSLAIVGVGIVAIGAVYLYKKNS